MEPVRGRFPQSFDLVTDPPLISNDGALISLVVSRRWIASFPLKRFQGVGAGRCRLHAAHGGAAFLLFTLGGGRSSGRHTHFLLLSSEGNSAQM